MLSKIIWNVSGIFVAYLLMGLLSERLYSIQFVLENSAYDSQKFMYPHLVTWISALFCAIAGLVRKIIKKQTPNPIPIKEQLTLSFLYSGINLTAQWSLIFLSYPVYAIGHNIRLLFVVLVGAFFSRVDHRHIHLRLGKHKILTALAITAAVVWFNMIQVQRKDNKKAQQKSQQWIGFLLMVASLLFDALFNDSQAYSKANFKPTANHLFTITNFYTFIISIVIAILTGTLVQSLHFVFFHSESFWLVILIGMCQVAGQLCIYEVITNFKQHVFPMISTSRKIMTVLLSIFFYNHTLQPVQWLAVLIVFVVMGYEMYEEISSNENNHQRIE